MLTADKTLSNTTQTTIDIFPNLITAVPSSQNTVTTDVPLTVRFTNDAQEFELEADGVYRYELDVAETL